MILIAGGGLAGLSAAYHLEESGADYLLLEKESHVGGLCRSIHKEGYTFDHSGHLLCFQKEETLSWVQSLLEDRLASFERKASIFLRDNFVPFPFQANLGALPPEIMRECLADFIVQNTGCNTSTNSKAWTSWVLGTFGEGMARHFFFPYHRKLWGVPLEELSREGLEWSVPRPSLQQVVDGAFGKPNPHMGYNPRFFYPLHGGIEKLPSALRRKISRIKTACGLRQILWEKKSAMLEDGRALSYEKAISSIPLPRLLRMLDPRVSWLETVASSLRWVDVWVLNVGVRRAHLCDQHWIYFPEKDYPFFRVGCYTAFGPHLAPKGCSSLYVEVPGHEVRAHRGEGWIRACLDGLHRCGILRSLDEVDLVEPLHLPVAYVIFDHHRSQCLPDAVGFLQEHAIYPVGRYGRWGYGTMEQALLQGKDVALGLVR